MTEYLDAMDAAPWFAAGGQTPPPRVLAALGPKMLELARDRAAGAHPYLVDRSTPRRPGRCWARARCWPSSRPWC
jgi:hypothetical protein